MEEYKLENIKKIIKDFFEKIGFQVDSNILIKDDTVICKIEYSDPSILIGKNGQTLFNIQHLISRIIKKNIKNEIFLDLDINDYKENKVQYLKELAQQIADEVALTKQGKVLPNLSAYERRIIHLELVNRDDVIAESSGEGPERKLIIKPTP
jgi:spoIIIJ-associated protein